MSARSIVTQILHQVLEQQQTLSSVLNEEIAFQNAGKDKPLIQEMSFGICRWYHQLDFILTALLDKPIRKKDRTLKYLLLVGLYQLRFMRIPQHAAVSETVTTCKHINMIWAKGLVNAVLRRYIREENQLNELCQKDLMAKTSHPMWLIEQLQKDWPNDWQYIIDANNSRPPMFLRVNQQYCDRETYIKQLSDADINATITSYSKQGIKLDNPVDVAQLPDFDKGKASVQDLAAQLSTNLLDLQPGQRVLDACAAPGGKAAHILETQADIESLIALDKEPERVKRLTETLNRLGLTAEIKTADAINTDSWWDKENFDRILLDIPCSATGVIRRHPDIKILRSQNDVKTINKIQKRLLKALWPTLKDKGLLLYVSCSILKQENTEVIKNFMNNNKNCKLKVIKNSWGVDTGFGRQILTGNDNMDGFFYACLEKN